MLKYKIPGPNPQNAVSVVVILVQVFLRLLFQKWCLLCAVGKLVNQLMVDKDQHWPSSSLYIVFSLDHNLAVGTEELVHPYV